MEKTIAIFTKNRTNPAYAGARVGADRAAERLGVRTLHYVPEKPDDIGEQTALIDAALAARPAAVVLVPVHPTAINASILKIVAAGVPLVGFLNRFTESGLVSYVGSDDLALAKRISTYLCERLGGRGDVIIVEGLRHSVTSLDRIRGFRDALAGFPQVRLVASIVGDYQHDVTKRAAAELLESGVHFDGVLATNDLMALAMIEALDERHRNATVIGVNAVPNAIDAIRQGKLLATVDFDAQKMAAVATEAAVRHLRGEAVPKAITLPVQIVDRTNCADWDRPFEQRTLLRWEDVAKSS